MRTDIQTIDFHGDALACVLKDDVPHVSVRHVCEALGIDPDTQRRKLQSARWACAVIMTVHDATGRQQELAMIPVRSLSMWMATVNPRKVGADVRAKLERYQVEAADVLDRYFRRGQRLFEPAGAAGEGASLIDRLLEQTDVMRRSLLLAAEHERRIADAEARVGTLERRAAAAEAARLAASEGLRDLPTPSVEVPEKTPIDDVGRLVKAWAGRTGVAIAEAWRRLYEEVRIRLHYDAHARAKKYPHGFRKADVLRLEAPAGVALEDFHARVYAIAYSMFAGAGDGGAIEESPANVPMSGPVAPPIAAATSGHRPWPLSKLPESDPYRAAPVVPNQESGDPY